MPLELLDQERRIRLVQGHSMAVGRSEKVLSSILVQFIQHWITPDWAQAFFGLYRRLPALILVR